MKHFHGFGAPIDPSLHAPDGFANGGGEVLRRASFYSRFRSEVAHK
jgi:hypothetical protein